jgi:ADP-ribose pyrophosphatase
MKEVIYRGRVFDLYREETTLPNGKKMMAEFIHHPGSSGVIPLMDENSVVLIHQYRPILKDFIWEIPSGTMLPGEDPLTCARRELEEECGLLSKRFEKLGEFLVAPWYSDERTHLFLAKELTPCGQKLDEDEILTTHIVSFDQAMKMIERGEIQDATTILGLQLVHPIFKRNRNGS